MRHPGQYAHAIESLEACLGENQYPEKKVAGILADLELNVSLAKHLRALYGEPSDVIADWVALAVFADLVRSGIVLLADRKGLRSRNAFVGEGVDLGVRPDLAAVLYRYLATRWHKARSSPPHSSALSRYLARQSGCRSRAGGIASENKIGRHDYCRLADAQGWWKPVHSCMEATLPRPRQEDFMLAQALEPTALERPSKRSVRISFYRDFYDEFHYLVGDYDRTDSMEPLALVPPEFSDDTHADSRGWIPFEIDETIIAMEGFKISSIVLAFDAWDASTIPDVRWQLRYGLDGPSYSGRNDVDSLAALAADMSQPAPIAFGDLDPRGDWYFRLASADNPCLDLSDIADIELAIEITPA